MKFLIHQIVVPFNQQVRAINSKSPNYISESYYKINVLQNVYMMKRAS